MAHLFATGTSAKSLRTTLSHLDAIVGNGQLLPETVLLPVEDRGLITPEGRILLQVLITMRDKGDYVIDADRALEALATSVETRSEWHRAWVQRQVSGTLSPPALGAAVFLLVNGSIGRQKALVMPVRESEDRTLANIVLPIIGKFSQTLGGKVPSAESGIRSHWAFTQVSRFLAIDVARDTESDGTALFVREGREQHLIDDLAARLAKWDPPAVSTAVDSLVREYRRVRGTLVNGGISFEDPTHTQKVTRALTAIRPSN
jgi:hypothetical protein